MTGHGRRVAEAARQVALRMGLADSEVQNVMLSGLLHDIGKLGLPDDLLTKPYNTLSGEQRTQVMKHPVIGQNILLGIDKFKDAALLVRHHHECYDGSGYPDRLSGIAIPQGSRILSTWSTITMRCKLAHWSSAQLKPGEAMSFLIENRGKRYDPAAVDAFATYISETHKPDVRESPLRTMHLKPGMQLSRDLVHRDGYMLLAKGSSLNSEIIGQLIKMEQAEQHTLTLYIRQEDK